MPDSPTKPRVHIYTDGACSPNPGTGGWGAILISADKGARKEFSGAQRDTTNNRMELTAAIEALKALKVPCQVELVTDSQYVMNGFTEGWLEKWQRNGWRTASKKPVVNVDLWRELLELTAKHETTWKWVRGHNANPMNNRCDELAVAARTKLTRNE